MSGRFSDNELASRLSAVHTSTPKSPFFTRNPEELRGMFIFTSLVKSTRGLGFTIIGGGGGTIADEFLQIKDVVPNGPAWCNGKLLMGDILVRVNGKCVLGYTNQNISELFQSIPAGELVQLEVCRGYPLPFDPSDPNTEILTTVAVSSANSTNSNVYPFRSENGQLPNRQSESAKFATDPMPRTVKSMPDLSSKLVESSHPSRHNSAGLLNPFAEETPNHTPVNLHSNFVMPEFLTVEIVKGAQGFGFTIADSSYGQKVKKILDRPRCKQLLENDLLCAINGQDVRVLAHADVVQLLKDCQCNDAAEIIIQRGSFFSTPRSKGKTKPRLSENLSHNPGPMLHSPSFNNSKSNSKTNGSYRSKTPTAELYSSKDKEPVMIARPKTPLVDARNWTMTSADYKMPFHRDPEGFDQPFYNHQSAGFELPPWGYTESNAKGPTQNHPWYPDNSRGQEWHNHNFMSVSHEGNSFSQSLPSRNAQAQSSPLKNPSQEAMKVSFNNYLNQNAWRDHQNLAAYTSAFQPLMNGLNSSSIYETAPYPLDEDKLIFNRSNINVSHHGQQNCSPNLQPFHNMHNRGTMNINVARKDFGSCDEGNNIQNFHSMFHNSNQISDSSLSRKHGTSFEHEQPTPYISNDSKNAYQNSIYRMDEPNGNLNYINTTVTLERLETGFGFRILGGTEEGSQASVGHIVPGGAADLDGSLRTGDEIIGIEGKCVLNSPHQYVVQLMSAAAETGKVTLNLRRLVYSEHANNAKAENGACDVTVTRNENEGFGFIIISSVNKSGSTIGRIIEGSPADRCGQLRVGDTILAVNGISIMNIPHGEIVNLIKDCGYSVTLTITSRHEDEVSTASLSLKGEDTSIEQDDTYQMVTLQRGTKGFGFSIRGGKEFHNMPLFVLKLADNHPAQLDGRLKVGDRIIEINGVSTKNKTHAEAIELIRKGGNTVRLLIKRSNFPSSNEN